MSNDEIINSYKAEYPFLSELSDNQIKVIKILMLDARIDQNTISNKLFTDAFSKPYPTLPA